MDVFIGIPSGMIRVKRDGSDFRELHIEKQREICLFLDSLLNANLFDVDSPFEMDYTDTFLFFIEAYERKQLKRCQNGEVVIGKLEAYEPVNSPRHYNTYSVETIDMMVSIWGKDKVADWCEITAFKYRMRMGTKPDNSIEQDLKKEQWYLNKAKELRQ